MLPYKSGPISSAPMLSKNVTTGCSSSRCCFAHHNAVPPLSCVFAFTSAPFSTKYLTTSKCPLRAPSCIGCHPLLSFALIHSLFFETSAANVSRSPLCAAKCATVEPVANDFFFDLTPSGWRCLQLASSGVPGIMYYTRMKREGSRSEKMMERDQKKIRSESGKMNTFL